MCLHFVCPEIILGRCLCMFSVCLFKQKLCDERFSPANIVNTVCSETVSYKLQPFCICVAAHSKLRISCAAAAAARWCFTIISVSSSSSALLIMISDRGFVRRCLLRSRETHSFAFFALNFFFHHEFEYEIQIIRTARRTQIVYIYICDVDALATVCSCCQ